MLKGARWSHFQYIGERCFPKLDFLALFNSDCLYLVNYGVYRFTRIREDCFSNNKRCLPLFGYFRWLTTVEKDNDKMYSIRLLGQSSLSATEVHVQYPWRMILYDF